MNMTITKHSIQPTIVSLTERIDAFNAPLLRGKLEALCAEGIKYFIIDLSEVQFLDSAGLAVFVNLLKRTQQEGGNVKMVFPKQEAARRILHLTRFDRVFEAVDTIEIALKNSSFH